MLTWADIVLLAILGISALIGIWRGFVSEVMSLLVWVAAFWLAFAFGPDVADMFQPHVDAPTARWFLGYATVFVLALVVGGLLNWLLGKLVKGTGLSGTDRLLGLCFGLLRGAAVACVLVLVAGFTPLPQEPVWQQSQLLPGFSRGAEWMRDWLPEALAEHLSFDPAQVAEAMATALPLPPLENADIGENGEQAAPPSASEQIESPAPVAAPAPAADPSRIP